ncbi:MAG: M28 family peptidase [Candidatus Thorarchaeota archaeon]
METQCGFGPRPPGSDNLTSCGDYIISVLENANWAVQTQTWTYQSTFLRNIMAGAIDVPNYVLLAHYDTRPIADMDPDPANRTQPILGANDGGSGVAALLELAAVLPPSAKDHVMLLFVDAEDSGNYNGWEWIVGSTYYVNSLTDNQKNAIHAAVLLDMVGDADLQLKREQSSTERLVDVIWGIASNLGYETMFLNEPGVSLIDDHRPFLSVGIPAIDIIDFDYPYWHTQADTLDKCSPSSLEVVGRVIEDFIQQQLILPTNFKSESLLPMIFFILLVIVMPIIVFILLILFIYQRKFQHNT